MTLHSFWYSFSTHIFLIIVQLTFFTNNWFIKRQTDVLISSIRIGNISVKCVCLILWFNSICYYIDIFESSILWVIFYELSGSIILCSNVFILGSICALISIRFVEIHSFTCWETLIQHGELSLRTLNDCSSVLIFHPWITIGFVLRLVRFLKHKLISILIINRENVIMKFIYFVTILNTLIFIFVEIMHIFHVRLISSIETIIEKWFVGIIICCDGD